MSILTLLVTFLDSLFKFHRQLVLENLALRQQVTMLRQSVKRPRATAADKLFCNKRDVNKRKHQTTRRTTTRRQGISRKPLQRIIGAESPGSSGITAVSFCPR